MEKKLLTPKDLKKQKQEAVTEPSKSTDNEPLELELRPWSDLPVEILERISSYLFLADRVRFPTVCKNWQAISIPNNRMIEPPWFVSLSKMDGICTLYDTSCGRTYQVNSPKLIGASIQSSKFGWLLLSKSSHNVTKLFFFNPLRADSTIDLPALPLVHSPVASFSASPISSNCLVCVVCPRSPHDSLAIYIHSEDQTVDWLHFNIGSLRPFVLQLHSPVVCHGLIYCIGHGGKVGILNTRNSLWIVASKSIWLNRVTGGVCMSISAKSMSITGIEDRRYWSWIPTEESKFHVVAYLQQIWWFEVDGLVKFSFPAGVYSLLFRLQLGRTFKRLGRRLCNYEHTHGWDIKPVRFELSTSDGQQVTREWCLDESENDDVSGNNKRGSWIEYYIGDFVVSSLEMLEVRFSMKQIDCTHSKGGLCVDSVSIIPSKLRGRTI